MGGMINLNEHDAALVATVRAAIDAALANAKSPIAVTKKICVYATRYRNQGREAARRRHAFAGVCEVSNAPLEWKHAQLDEMDPEFGYSGRLRWVCSVANNSGKHSCGVCTGPARAGVQ
jgi:hypothetical protein